MATTRAPRLPAALSAYVLHRYDWSETSLILDLFTRELGRVAVVAKGAKRPYSQLRSVLLPFQRITVALGRPPKTATNADTSAGDNPGEVMNLRSAEWAGGPSMLTGSALFSGFYLNELLMKLLARHDPHPALFDAYVHTLPGLASADEAHNQAALRAFELSLLMALGVLPDLSLVTLTQEAVEPSKHYNLLAEAGVTAPRVGEGALSGEVLIGLQAALQHGSWPALHQACERGLPELRGVLRGLLHYHLGTSSLRTRQVMLDVQAL
jgi:DNA repair protein RecO (recombination protein O)